MKPTKIGDCPLNGLAMKQSDEVKREEKRNILNNLVESG